MATKIDRLAKNGPKMRTPYRFGGHSGTVSQPLALRIRQIATEFGIPIVERKALARAIYESVEIGQYVPERFYRAIAEILAYIYELTGRSMSSAPRELVGA